MGQPMVLLLRLAVKMSHTLICHRAVEQGCYVPLVEDLLAAEILSISSYVILREVRSPISRSPVCESGHFSAEVDTLGGPLMAPLTLDTVRAVQDLFSDGPTLHLDVVPMHRVREGGGSGALRRFKIGRAPGMGAAVVEGMVHLVNTILRGKVPLPLGPFVAGALLVPFQKPFQGAFGLSLVGAS